MSRNADQMRDMIRDLMTMEFGTLDCQVLPPTETGAALLGVEVDGVAYVIAVGEIATDVQPPRGLRS